MEFLKLSSHHYLDHIDLDTFTYPNVTCRQGHDRYDNSDYIQAWCVPQYAPNSNSLYYDEYGDHATLFPKLKAEVALWNSDPKGYWTEEIIRLHELRITQLELNMAKEKAMLKKSKKALKKLQDKDK